MPRSAPDFDLTALREAVEAGTVDTVVVACCDLQGRLVGKRVTGWYFLDAVAEHSLEACNYLFAVDVDMTPLPGFRFANWDQGYGDVSLVPDLGTLRRIPWLEGTALVLCDVVDEGDRTPVEVAPRQILRAPRSNGPAPPGSFPTSVPSSSSSFSATATPNSPSAGTATPTRIRTGSRTITSSRPPGTNT